MPLLLLLAASLPVAYAAPVKPAGEVTLSGVVEVPLYAGLSGEDGESYVEATAGDKKLLLRVAIGHRDLWLNESAAKKLGLKVSTRKVDGKEEKSTTVESFTIGGATFTKMKATVSDLKDSGPLEIDGEIGLTGFEGLAFAVLPSTGTLRLATGADGAALVSSVGKAVPATTTWETKKVKIGEKKYEIMDAPLVVPVKWSGVEVPAEITTEGPRTWLAREIEGVDWYQVKDGKAAVKLPEAPSAQTGEVRTEWRELTIGDATVPAYVRREGRGPVMLHPAETSAQVGADVTSGLDLAYDPVTGTFAARVAPASKRADYAPTYEAALRAALEAKPGKDGAAPDEAAKKAARTAGLGSLAKFLEARGRYEEAIEARKELTVAKADDCTSWTNLGKSLVAVGRPAEAIEPLTKASALYQPWAVLPLSEREQIAKDKAAAEKKKEEWTGAKPQDHACHVAPGYLALAQLQSKNAAAVASLYPAQLDLDTTLPLAAGNAALLQGQFDAAQAAYLQALKLSGGKSDAARVGLYLALAPKDFAAARQQLERLRLRYNGDTDPLLVRLYVEGVRQSQGAEGVKTALDALLAADPGNAVLLAQRSKERAAAGDAAGAAADWTAAKERFEARLASLPNDADTIAAWASALAAAGQGAEAQKAAEAALKLAPTNGMAWLAAADAATAVGDATKAAEARAKAGTVWASHPGYALLLAQ